MAKYWNFFEFAKRQRPEPELPIVAQVGDVIVFEGKFYRIDENCVTELPIVQVPVVR